MFFFIFSIQIQQLMTQSKTQQPCLTKKKEKKSAARQHWTATLHCDILSCRCSIHPDGRTCSVRRNRHSHNRSSWTHNNMLTSQTPFRHTIHPPEYPCAGRGSPVGSGLVGIVLNCKALLSRAVVEVLQLKSFRAQNGCLRRSSCQCRVVGPDSTTRRRPQAVRMICIVLPLLVLMLLLVFFLLPRVPVGSRHRLRN